MRSSDAEDEQRSPLLPLPAPAASSRSRRTWNICAEKYFIDSNVFMVLVAGAVVLYFLVTLRFSEPRQAFELEQSWAQWSPYFPVKQYVPPPDDCQVVQVNILQRHGARFPTTHFSSRILDALAKLKSASRYIDPQLHFISEYDYDLGVDDLTELGASESLRAGEEAFARYERLLRQKPLPFVRSSGSERDVLSATNWTAGFARASWNTSIPQLDLVIPQHLNSTLESKMCPNARPNTEQTTIWLTEFASSIAARLNAGATGANLTAEDAYSVMALCPFDAVAKDRRRNGFCPLFREEEWRAFEYMGDLDKYYGTGYGQKLGRVQGVGYVNELLARLTGHPVQDSTQTNRTLDGSPETFPLDRPMYVDFSHDNVMIAIYSALGLFRPRTTLDPLVPDQQRTWMVARMVPFAGRLVVEKVKCGKGLYVRILVNDGVQRMPFCRDMENGRRDRDGMEMCTLDAFVRSQEYARTNGRGDFEMCYLT